MDDDKTTTVQSIMTPLPLETANPSTNVHDIANKMKEKNKGAIIIVEAQKKRDNASGSGGSGGTDKPIGIITERDIVRRVVATNESTDPKKILASKIMSQPLITVGDEASIYDAGVIMTKYGIRRLPIAKDNILLGIVTATDLAKRMYEKNKEDPVLMAMSRFQLLEQQK